MVNVIKISYHILIGLIRVGRGGVHYHDSRVTGVGTVSPEDAAVGGALLGTVQQVSLAEHQGAGLRTHRHESAAAFVSRGRI